MAVREILKLEIKLMATQISLVEKAKFEIEKGRIEQSFEKERQQELKTFNETAKDIWDNFHEMSYMISKAEGKMSFTDIWALSVRNCYILKNQLHKEYQRSKNKVTREG